MSGPKRRADNSSALNTSASRQRPPDANVSPTAAIRSRIQTWLLSLLLLGLVIAVYQPIWKAGFIWGDDVPLAQSQLLTTPGGWERAWLSLDSSSPYAPLVYTGFRIESALWGANAAGYHWVNLLLHAACAVAVWLLLRRLRVPGAWLGGALFALHPVQVESVAWVAERGNVLSLLFFLLSLLAWLGFVERDQDERSRTGRWTCYGLALAFCVLALFSRNTACLMTLAPLLVLWLRKKPIRGRAIVQVAPFLAAGLAMGLVTLWWERHQGGSLGNLGPLERVLGACRAFWFYLGKLVVPIDLSFDYSRWTLNASQPIAYAWLALTLLLGAAVWLARRVVGRGPAVAFVFFVAALGPMAGLFGLSGVRHSFVADHWLYAASIGPLALAAAGLGALLRGAKFKALATPVVTVVLLGLLGFLTSTRARAFQNSEALWRDTLAKNPDSLLARRELARLLVRGQRAEEALEQYQQALRIDPANAGNLVAMGNTLITLKRPDEAIPWYEKALAADPNNAEAHANLGVLFANQGRADDALLHLRKTVELDPQHVAARLNLAAALAAKGEFAEAVPHYEAALKLNPDQPMTQINLAIALAILGRVDEAAENYQKAAAAMNAQAVKLEQQGRVDEAAAQLREAIRLIPNNAESHYALAMLLVRQGKPADARPHLNQALALKPDFTQAKAALEELRRNAK